MSTSELILYLTPEGPLGDRCAAFFQESAERFGSTSAHTYPPHVTLTGFFHRGLERIDEIRIELDDILPRRRIAPAGSVEIVGLTTGEGWVGLEVQSLWAQQVTCEFVRAHRVRSGEDPLRPKDWLHLSLAYGLAGDQELTDFAALARETVEPAAPVEWRIGLWERRPDGSWLRHEI